VPPQDRFPHTPPADSFDSGGERASTDRAPPAGPGISPIDSLSSKVQSFAIPGEADQALGLDRMAQDNTFSSKVQALAIPGEAGQALGPGQHALVQGPGLGYPW
jgi:hypothetical protein